MKEFKTEINITVRFSETDAMGVVWHGNYLKFLEDAREAFGEKFGLTYLDIYNNGFFTPIVKSELDFKGPVYYGNKVSVIIKYIPSAAAKIIFEYKVMNLSTNTLCAAGKTIQVFLDAKSRMLQLNKPAFYSDWEIKNNIEVK